MFMTKPSKHQIKPRKIRGFSGQAVQALQETSESPARTEAKSQKNPVYPRREPTQPCKGPWEPTLCYAIVLPGQNSGIRAEFRPNSNRVSLKIGPAIGRRPAGGPILMRSLLESGRNLSRSPFSGPGALLRNIG